MSTNSLGSDFDGRANCCLLYWFPIAMLIHIEAFQLHLLQRIGAIVVAAKFFRSLFRWADVPKAMPWDTLIVAETSKNFLAEYFTRNWLPFISIRNVIVAADGREHHTVFRLLWLWRTTTTTTNIFFFQGNVNIYIRQQLRKQLISISYRNIECDFNDFVAYLFRFCEVYNHTTCMNHTAIKSRAHW